jgi:hypothetical protein
MRQRAGEDDDNEALLLYTLPETPTPAPNSGVIRVVAGTQTCSATHGRAELRMLGRHAATQTPPIWETNDRRCVTCHFYKSNDEMYGDVQERRRKCAACVDLMSNPDKARYDERLTHEWGVEWFDVHHERMRMREKQRGSNQHDSPAPDAMLRQFEAQDGTCNKCAGPLDSSPSSCVVDRVDTTGNPGYLHNFQFLCHPCNSAKGLVVDAYQQHAARLHEYLEILKDGRYCSQAEARSVCTTCGHTKNIFAFGVSTVPYKPRQVCTACTMHAPATSSGVDVDLTERWVQLRARWRWARPDVYVEPMAPNTALLMKQCGACGLTFTGQRSHTPTFARVRADGQFIDGNVRLVCTTCLPDADDPLLRLRQVDADVLAAGNAVRKRNAALILASVVDHVEQSRPPN